VTAERVDVLIVGAGLVGTTAALLYAKAGFSVLLADNRPALRSVVDQADGLNLRTVALAHRSVQLMREAGIWQTGDACPINAIHVSERGRFGSVRLRADEFGVGALGYVVSNQSLEQQLLAAAIHHPNVRLEYAWSLDHLAETADGIEVAARREGQSVNTTCRLLIAADGTESTVRRLLGLEVRRQPYGQSAIVGNIECARSHQNEAFERFTEFGPLALLPIGERQMSMVLTLPERDTDTTLAMSDADFLGFVQGLFGGRLGRLQRVGRRHAFGLSLVESRQQAIGRCVLLGNAARTLHPVAGQGLNLALRDVFQLAGSAVGGSDPGDNAVLQHFLTRRQSDQRRVVRQTDLLARIFRSQPAAVAPVLGLLKSSSMVTLDLIPGLRRSFGALNAGIGVPLDLPLASKND
jgi:2-octaprenyl-6-methoxyphenol hydroxylase